MEDSDIQCKQLQTINSSMANETTQYRTLNPDSSVLTEPNFETCQYKTLAQLGFIKEAL